MFRDDPAETIAPPPRRTRFWLLVVGLPLLFGVLALVGWLVSINTGLQSALAEADRLDPGWRLEEIEAARETPPPGRNAAERVVAVKGLLANNWQDPKKYELLTNLSPPAQLNEQQLTALKAMLAAAGPALAEARSLIETPRGRHAITWTPDVYGTLLTNQQEHRAAVALLNYDALERAQAGDLGRAVAACHAAFHAGCSMGDEPLAISQLIRIACQAVAVSTLERVLAQGEAPEARLAALQARLEAEEPAPLFLIAARGERALGNRFFENIRNGSLPAGNAVTIFGGGLPPGLALLFNIPGALTSQQTAHIRFLTELVEVARRPPQEWEAAGLAAFRANATKLPVLARLLAPAMDKIAQACQRNHAILRNAIVALAAERYRQKHGRWPATLDELVQAGLLKSAPVDPYDGRPLRLRRTGDGLMVYSVGPDNADNGGVIDRQNPIKAGTDLGFQLWDVAARRQPPPPPKPPEDSPDVNLPAGDNGPPGAPPAGPPP